MPVHRMPMPVFLCEKKAIRDERLSLAARGLYALIYCIEEQDNGEGWEDLKALPEIQDLLDLGYLIKDESK